MVAPLVGAWIEIKRICYGLHKIIVAPLVGAWIEIVYPVMLQVSNQSLLL